MGRRMAVDCITVSSRDYAFLKTPPPKNLSNSGQWAFLKKEMIIMIV
jgi:hypothetical protein